MPTSGDNTSSSRGDISRDEEQGAQSSAMPASDPNVAEAAEEASDQQEQAGLWRQSQHQQ